MVLFLVVDVSSICQTWLYSGFLATTACADRLWIRAWRTSPPACLDVDFQLPATFAKAFEQANEPIKVCFSLFCTYPCQTAHLCFEFERNCFPLLQPSSTIPTSQRAFHFWSSLPVLVWCSLLSFTKTPPSRNGNSIAAISKPPWACSHSKGRCISALGG